MGLESFTNDVALMMSTDAVTYARHTTQVVRMETYAEVTKVIITAVTQQYRQELAGPQGPQLRQLNQRS